jgi:hypothetical protein
MRGEATTCIRKNEKPGLGRLGLRRIRKFNMASTFIYRIIYRKSQNNPGIGSPYWRVYLNTRFFIQGIRGAS